MLTDHYLTPISYSEIWTMNEEVLLRRFEWSVRALAQRAYVQLSLYPEFVCVADELVLEFDEWRVKLLDTASASDWPKKATRLIEQLDRQISDMSGPPNEELWTDRALVGSEEWQKVRDLANELIHEMKWSNAPPPPDRDIYVGPE